MNRFKKIRVSGWRQFSDVDIDFHPNLTILTGANGAGKSTILGILNQHFGWPTQFVSTPERDKKDGILKYLSGIWSENTFIDSDPNKFGEIRYATGAAASLTSPTSNAGQFQVQIINRQHVDGLHIPSHRPVFYYRPVASIPTGATVQNKIFNMYRAHIMMPFNGGHQDKPPNALLKETLIALALFGEGNSHVSPNTEARDLFLGFQKILAAVLPEEIGFEKIHIENPEVVFITKSGPFSLDASSGGIAAIIDLVWQVYMGAAKDGKSVITIDEPENHLHPKLQRIILPNLMNAFPNTQFIVVTHNPFVVTSVPDSSVYILDFGKDSKVSSRKLDLVNRAGDANEILRSVLGLPTASPVWVEQKIDQLIQKYSETGLSKDTAAALKNDMIESGLGNLFPDTVSKVL